jgi:copper transport protein
VRFVSFVLLLFCVGGAFMAALMRDVPSQTRYVLVGAALLLAVLSLVGIVCQGAEAGGTGFRDALDADVISDVLHSRFGQAWGIRAGIAIWLAGFALLGSPLRWVTAGVAFALVPTTSLAAHAEADGTGTVVVDLVHVTAAALWAGGLMFVMLALLLERRGSRWGLAALLVPRFSAVAFVSVAVLVSAGVLNAYLELRSWDALLHTSYGQLVLAKAALVVPILVLGAYNRQFSVPALGSGAATPLQQRRFVRGASAELVILAAILAVTAALVAEPPGKAVVGAPAGPVTATEQAGPFEVELEVAPARVGANRISVAAREEDGSLANVDEVRVSASLPGSQVADLTFDARRSGRGQYAVRRATFPVAGTWKVRIDVRRGEFDEWTAMFDVPIRG